MGVVVDDCCGFIKLRNGCFIIGYLNLISSIYLAIKSVSNIVQGDSLMRQNVAIPHNTMYIIGMSLVIMYSVIFVASLLELIFSILLLVGLYQNRRGFVMSHFVYNSVFLVIYAIAFGSYLFSGHMTFVLLMSDLFAISVTIYCLLVIWSYYIEMGKEVKPDTECEDSHRGEAS